MDIKFKVDKYHEYDKCQKVGKAVIVCNFMNERSYASTDCKNLQTTLKAYGFETLGDEEDMVYKNLTKPQFTDLYIKAARENYGPRNRYACVLFIVMSYGKPGLIKCHSEKKDGSCEYVEQKNLLEAFQPQNNNLLACKPKLFIIQTIPESEGTIDARCFFEDFEEFRHVKRIPREADFLTYTCESDCINYDAKNDKDKNVFVRSIVEIFEEQMIKGRVVEIQKLLIKSNGKYKEARDKDDCEIFPDCKIPCVMSSLTGKLYLEPSKCERKCTSEERTMYDKGQFRPPLENCSYFAPCHHN